MSSTCECPVCGASITKKDDMVSGELITCGDCGVELEVVKLDPFELQEAPQEEEDWGE